MGFFMSSRNRFELLKINTFTSIIFQLSSIVYGLIVPILYVKYYGSDVNGLVTSITQFLGIIAFLELGVGAIVQSALYKPLAIMDYSTVNEIMEESKRYFKKIAYVLGVYVFILVFTYPFIIGYEFSFFTTTVLILSVSINLLMQYYFGLSDQILLMSDQRIFVNNSIQIGILLITALSTVGMIINGATIEQVKITASLIIIIRPILLHLYVKKHYKLFRTHGTKSHHLTQKWNGIAHHISYVIVEQTDVLVLTVFSTLSSVSVYFIYYIIILGIRQLIIFASSGVQSLLGNIYAIESIEYVKKYFKYIEWMFHTVCTFLFTITGILIIPFVKVYTKSIVDANYIYPAFSILLVLAQYLFCIRQPYNMLVRSASRYKETQLSAIIEAIINVVVSIILVINYGLIGVAIGTLLAMLYRTVYLSIYANKILISSNYRSFIKQILINVVIASLTILLSSYVVLEDLTYIDWIIMAFKVTLINLVISIVVNIIFYDRETSETFQALMKMVIRR